MLDLKILSENSCRTSEYESQRARRKHSGNSSPKIALIQPDSPHLFVPNNFPSLGLLYISSHLKNHGYNSEFFDFTARGNKPYNNNKMTKPLDGFDIYAFSSQITQFKEATEMMKQIRDRNPNAYFVVGGPFVSRSPQYALREEWDVVGQGEGEDSLLQVVNNFPNIKRGSTVAAINYVDPNIFPDWEAINPLDYIYQLDGKRCINIMTKRGNCPFHCTFCALQEIGVSKLRNRNIENVLNEAKFLQKKYGFGSLAIYDDEVLMDKKRDETLFRGFKELGMPYRAMTRANLADENYIKMLAETGCGEVCIGLESADPFIHEVVVEKGTTVEDHSNFLKYSKKHGLRVKTFLIVGLPSESRESIKNTKKWLRENQPENFDVSIFTPYPGSLIYKKREFFEIDWDQDHLEEIWFTGKAQYDDCAVWTPYLSSRNLLEIKEELTGEFKRGRGGTTPYFGPIESLQKNSETRNETQNKEDPDWLCAK